MPPGIVQLASGYENVATLLSALCNPLSARVIISTVQHLCKLCVVVTRAINKSFTHYSNLLVFFKLHHLITPSVAALHLYRFSLLPTLRRREVPYFTLPIHTYGLASFLCYLIKNLLC